MKKIVPFKKDIIFKTNLSEIVSISLEHSLHLEKNSLITGEFIVSGEYKMADTSVDTETFSFNLPFDINIDERYILDNMTVDIDDFYYEIVNNNILSVNIEVLIDKLSEKPVSIKPQVIEIIEDEIPEPTVKVQKESVRETKDEAVSQLVKEAQVESIKESLLEEIREEIIEERPMINSESISTIFDDFDESRETYATYQIYIVRESDSIETILQKYSIGKEDLEQYNELKELKIGDKLIIPQTANAQNQ